MNHEMVVFYSCVEKFSVGVSWEEVSWDLDH
jgi:hypothetical protein